MRCLSNSNIGVTTCSLLRHFFSDNFTDDVTMYILYIERNQGKGTKSALTSSRKLPHSYEMRAEAVVLEKKEAPRILSICTFTKSLSEPPAVPKGEVHRSF